MGSGGALTVNLVFSYKVHNLNDHANRIVFAVVANRVFYDDIVDKPFEF